MSKSKFQTIYIWRAIFCLASIALLAWLFWQNLVPTGVLILEHRKVSPASPISDLHPQTRVIDLKDDGSSQRFFGDPVYFDVKVPRQFDKVVVDISWQNQAQPILELGARKIRGEFAFVLKPLQNKIIEGEEVKTWSCERYGEIIFCQKKKKYQRLSDFFAQPAGRVVTYHYTPSERVKYDIMNVNTRINDFDYLIANYEPPESLGSGWYRRRVVYDWQDFALHINQISFIVSAPKLQEGHGQIVVGDIKVTLQRPPLDWPGFVEYMKNQVRRLK